MDFPFSTNSNVDFARNGIRAAGDAPAASVPDATEPWVVCHRIPGRLRLRPPAWVWRSPWRDRLQPALEAWPAVTAVRLNRTAGSAVVCHAGTAETVLATIVPETARCLLEGSSPEPPRSRGALAIAPPAAVDRPTRDGEEPGDRRALALPVLAASLTALSRYGRLPWLRPLAAIALLVAWQPIAQRALASLARERRLNIDCLDATAIGLSLLQGRLWVPALTLALHEIGDSIREQTARTTAARAATLADTIGSWAWVLRDGESPERIPSDRLQPGDWVAVYPGEQIPADGIVLEGEATVDCQSLTGESMPVVARTDSLVFASTLVRSGQLVLRAVRVGDRTRAAAGLRLLQQAPVYDTRMADYAEKVADRLIGPSLAIAAVVLLWTRDPARAAAILTLDFVTGIRVSIPTAFLGALNHTTRHGVLVRSGRTLEQLAEIDTVVFDKTGTLTAGRIAVTAIEPVADGLSPERLLQLAAAAEQRLTHPVAEAIVECARQRGVEILPRGDWDYRVGFGVQAQVDGKVVCVGSERFLRAECALDAPTAPLPGDGDRPQVYVACDGRWVGTLAYADPLRRESARLVRMLSDYFGIQPYLLTGDGAAQAARVAAELDIPAPQVYAEAFPEQKAKIVSDLRRAGRTVAFVGDGLNDSAALAYADVSVSFERGAEIARETADVVLMDDNLLDFLEAIAIARETRDAIEQNVALVVVPNLVALGLASTAGLNPLVATLVHNGSAIAAGLNSLRPLVRHEFVPSSITYPQSVPRT